MTDNCTIVILAGGEGSRMKELGKFFPKPMMVAYDNPLLIRLIDQIQKAGFTRVTVSTRHPFHSELAKLILNYSEKFIDNQREVVQIKVLDNPAHLDGSLEALCKILEQIKTTYSLMCFSDIFFLENPFKAFLLHDTEDIDYLGVAESIDLKELTHGGIVYCEDHNIRSIVEIPQPNPLIEGAVRWSGLALFNTRKTTDDLKVFLSKAPQGSPEGDFFEFRRRHGKVIRAIWGSDFINVNSPEHLLLTTLYTAIEKIYGPPELIESMRKLASLLRRTFT